MESGTSTEISFETAMSAAQENTEVALKSSGALTRELRKARKAAGTGQVRELRRALDNAVVQARELLACAKEVRDGFDFDEAGYLMSGGYAKELLALAAERDVDLYEEDERLLCYPSVVRIVPGEPVVEIDRKRERRIRPSILLGLLAARQAKPGKFRAGQLMESIAIGYDLVIARDGKKRDAVVRLQDIWSVLTLLPGQTRSYTRQEFARDLYLLDQSDVSHAGDGRVLRWHASSGTRTAGVLTTVSRTGQRQLYWGVSFTAGAGQ